MISFVVAFDTNYLIGNKNALPWARIPRDMTRFRSLTLGKTIVMGRKTFESIGHALPDRRNIVLTTEKAYTGKQIAVFHSIEEVLELAKKEEIIVIGGASLFEAFLPYTKTIFVTRIKNHFEGDVHFPSHALESFTCTAQEDFPADEKSPYDLSFETYRKI